MFKNIKFLTLMMLLLVGASIMFGCGKIQDQNASAADKGTISGKVYDKNGNPASGISVTLNSLSVSSTSLRVSTRSVKALTAQTATSGSNGSFSFTNVSPGTYNVQADQSDQYKVIKQNIVIASGVTVDLGTLTLAQTGAITGAAYFADSSNHLGIDVFIPGTSFTAKTANSGSYSILYIPAGTYEVDAMFTAYKTASAEDITVVSGASTSAPSLVLNPEAGGTYGGVTFEARDQFTGAGIQGVNVTVGHVSKTTGSDGTAYFDKIWAASQSYSGGKTGYQNYSAAVNVTANAIIRETFWMTSNNFTTATWGSSGAGNGQFNAPYGIAVDSSNNVFVADGGNQRVQKFTSSGSFVTKWTTGAFDPKGIGIDSGNNVYAAIYTNVKKFDNNGGLLLTFGSDGTNDGQFSSGYSGAYGVSLASGGDIYVVDPGSNRVQKFNALGNFLSKFGSIGTGNGQFSYGPKDIAIDSSGNIFVSDMINHRIQKFDSSGNFITKWGSQGSGNGQFGNDTVIFNFGICVDSSGNVYVADTGNNRIQKFDNNGNFLTTWGTQGTGDGQLGLPVDVAVDAGGNVYVSENGNRRIQKFSQ